MMPTELDELLDRATAIFCQSEDGEDRESMSAYWVNVARCAHRSAATLAAFLDIAEATNAAIAADNEAALEQLDNQAAQLFQSFTE